MDGIKTILKTDAHYFLRCLCGSFTFCFLWFASLELLLQQIREFDRHFPGAPADDFLHLFVWLGQLQVPNRLLKRIFQKATQGFFWHFFVFHKMQFCSPKLPWVMELLSGDYGKKCTSYPHKESADWQGLPIRFVDNSLICLSNLVKEYLDLPNDRGIEEKQESE